MKGKDAKSIIDVLSVACDVPIRDVCVLHHDETHFKAYVHGTSWYSQRAYDIISKAWEITEDQISMEQSPKCWWPLGSTGYVIEVKY